jgi:hypothetical protein
MKYILSKCYRKQRGKRTLKIVFSMMTIWLLSFSALSTFTTQVVAPSEPATEWSQTYGGADWDRAFSVRQTSDGGYITAGGTRSFGAGGRDVWLVKTDANGNIMWSQTYGGASSDVARSVQQTSDEGYVIAGRTMSFGAGSSDSWLIKLAPPTPPSITATIDINPDTLNLKSKGEWITAYIELPEGSNVTDIDRLTILLNDTIPVDPFWLETPVELVVGDYDNDTIPDLMVKFNRTEVASYIYHVSGIEYGNVTLTLTGELFDGASFEGSDTIRAHDRTSYLLLTANSNYFKTTILGDVNLDGKFDGYDVAAAAHANGIMGTTTLNKEWDPALDEYLGQWLSFRR